MRNGKDTQQWKPNKRRLIIAAVCVAFVIVICQVLAVLYKLDQKPTLTLVIVNLFPLVLLTPPMFYLTVTFARWLFECKFKRK
jgi:hypothetical protein